MDDTQVFRHIPTFGEPTVAFGAREMLAFLDTTLFLAVSVFRDDGFRHHVLVIEIMIEFPVFQQTIIEMKFRRASIAGHFDVIVHIFVMV